MNAELPRKKFQRLILCNYPENNFVATKCLHLGLSVVLAVVLNYMYCTALAYIVLAPNALVLPRHAMRRVRLLELNQHL